jgi:hypothetical protein
MGYRPRHKTPAGGRGTLAVLGVITTAGFLMALALPASATVPTIAKVNNTAVGEAGYYINDNGSTRIRDVQASTVITSQMEDLNGSASPGGVGVELCNDNTGYAAQVGLEYDATTSSFVAEYNYTNNPGYDSTNLGATSGSDPDPCVEGGLLNGGLGQSFNNFLNASPDTAAGAIHIGDTVHFEIYYSPNGRHDHSLSFKISDVTQDITRVQTVQIPAQEFYEAGIGVVSQANDLTGGAVNLINTFTGAFFNWYGNHGAPPVGIDSTHWDLEMADFVNASSQVTLTPSALSDGNTSFQELEGSTSP